MSSNSMGHGPWGCIGACISSERSEGHHRARQEGKDLVDWRTGVTGVPGQNGSHRIRGELGPYTVFAWYHESPSSNGRSQS